MFSHCFMLSVSLEEAATENRASALFYVALSCVLYSLAVLRFYCFTSATRLRSKLFSGLRTQPASVVRFLLLLINSFAFQAILHFCWFEGPRRSPKYEVWQHHSTFLQHSFEGLFKVATSINFPSAFSNQVSFTAGVQQEEE
jgi:hypothetical protein